MRRALSLPLLHAFLAHINRVESLFCLSLLHYERGDDLKHVFPEYDPQTNINGLRENRFRPFEEPPQHSPPSTYLQMRHG